MKKDILYRLVRIVVVTTFLIATTIMWFNKYQNENYIKNTIYEMMNNNINFVELSSGIKLENAYPLKDSEIDELKGYQFELKKKKKESIPITIVLQESKIPNEEKRLKNTFLKYEVIKNGKILISPSIVSEDGILFKDTLDTDSIYEVKLWLGDHATNEAMGKYFSSKIALL